MTKPYVFHLGETKNASGKLNYWEQSQLPFEVRRAFWITEVPAGGIRGVHAHKSDNQLTVCLQGSVSVALEDLEGNRYEFMLQSTKEALYLPRLVWSSFTFTADSVLLVLSESDFDESDYIRNKEEFDKLKDGHSEKL
ncbi:sugar 3,4-ketoisomerase [Echinicola vietnamensis]|uniref:WxcM-like protein n=1 Tax=Echinicola vietnamensis (strain DSM 17526 / LMG 23754 / KMM 6221) TaxID=926556 RepID=L0FYT6_ECHVK|nr:FdtA/QdtA family cupin domain-containing protein [Echinicola vietnamensis]AGA79059.1 WxcM-like protein [Echinicola vietnamensis DSM 17526]